MLGLTLLWLAAMPCEGLEAELQHLAEVAEHQPAALEAQLEALEARWGGLPLRAPRARDESPAARAESASRRLRSACAQLTAAAQEVAPPRSDPSRLQEILSRPEFSRARQRQGDTLDRLLRLLVTWLERLLESQGAQSFAVGTRAVVLGLSLAVVLFAALRLRHWRRGPARRRTQEGTAAGLALTLASPAEHLARARRSLAAHPREAIREGLLALLSSLEVRRLARPDRVRTNRELVAELPGRGAPPQLTQEVERLVRWYDRTFYSLAPVSPDDAARFVDEVERLHQGLAGAAA